MSKYSLVNLLLLCVFVVPGCSLFAEETDGSAEILPFETIRTEYKVEAKTPEFFVIRSAAEEAAFLTKNPEGALPDIDYSKWIVAGVIAGVRSNDSYQVTIDSVKAGNSVVIYSTEIGSAGGGRVVTYPAHIIALNRSDVGERAIEFAEMQRTCEVEPCWQ